MHVNFHLYDNHAALVIAIDIGVISENYTEIDKLNPLLPEFFLMEGYIIKCFINSSTMQRL